jgi:ATP-dependent RNA helicase RhlE
VATDIAARGIDVTALGHVINFDVPAAPEDYIHRVGRTARAELTGSAYTLVAPEDEDSIRAIERSINKRLPRVTVPDFDYRARSDQRLEVPHAQRIAEIRARKAEERQRAKANVERRARQAHSAHEQPQGSRPAGPRSHRPRPHGPGPRRRFRPRRSH